jgi:hypothetical protein
MMAIACGLLSGTSLLSKFACAGLIVSVPEALPE